MQNFQNKYKNKRKSFVKKEIIYDARQLYNYGINRLSTRNYGRKELSLKMQQYQKDIAMVDSVLDKLEEQGYLSDERRIRSILSQYQYKESINKTKMRLSQKGFTKEQIEEVLEKQVEIISPDSEFTVEEETILKLLETKFKLYNKDNWEKMVRFLASKGYKYPVISKCIKLFSEIDI